MGRLEGRRAVITGAASGIGEATARLFAREGAVVVVADVDDDRGKRVADDIGERARFVHTDVTQEADVDAAVAAAVDTFGGLDCMFNNAGNPGSVAGIAEVDMAMFDLTVAIHLRGVFLGIRAAARVMKPQGHGTIINTSSVAGLAANYAGHEYSACKAAIAHLTRTTANELGEHGIRVNAICPGGIATAIFARAAGLEGDTAQATVELMSSGAGRHGADPPGGPTRRHRRSRLVAGERRFELRERPSHRRRRRPHHRPPLPRAARQDRRAHAAPAGAPVLTNASTEAICADSCWVPGCNSTDARGGRSVPGITANIERDKSGPTCSPKAAI